MSGRFSANAERCETRIYQFAVGCTLFIWLGDASLCLPDSKNAASTKEGKATEQK
jgi:hypothetical protein